GIRSHEGGCVLARTTMESRAILGTATAEGRVVETVGLPPATSSEMGDECLRSAHPLRRIVSSIIQETILARVRTMFGPDEVKIETPEQIELGLEPSGPGSRLVAWVLDALIKVGCLVVLGLLVLILGTLLGVREDA